MGAIEFKTSYVQLSVPKPLSCRRTLEPYKTVSDSSLQPERQANVLKNPKAVYPREGSGIVSGIAIVKFSENTAEKPQNRAFGGSAYGVICLK